MNGPLVSVVLPVYNAEKYIQVAIESILGQSYTNLEMIIIDDGSTDNSLSIIKSFTDKRIRLVQNDQNLKLIRTLNKGLELSRGVYIARMDADDIAMPERLEKQVKYLEVHSSVGICGSYVEIFGDQIENKVWKYPLVDKDIRAEMLFKSPFAHPSVMLRKQIISDYNIRYNERYLHAEDYDFWVLIAEKSQLANIPEVLLKYRIHNNQVGSRYTMIQRENTSIIIKKLLNKFGVKYSRESYRYHQHLIEEKGLDSSQELRNVRTWAEGLINSLQAQIDKKHLIETVSRKYFYCSLNSMPYLGFKSFWVFFFYRYFWSSFRPGYISFLIKSLIRSRT